MLFTPDPSLKVRLDIAIVVLFELGYYSNEIGMAVTFFFLYIFILRGAGH